jgi:hypothetical protein
MIEPNYLKLQNNKNLILINFHYRYFILESNHFFFNDKILVIWKKNKISRIFFKILNYYLKKWKF